MRPAPQRAASLILIVIGVSGCCRDIQYAKTVYWQHAFGVLTGDYVSVAPILPQATVAPKQLVWLAFADGAWGSPTSLLPSKETYGKFVDEDSHSGTSYALRALFQATGDFQAPPRTAPLVFTTYSNSPQQMLERRQAILKILKEAYRKFSVEFTFTRPPPTQPYAMLVFTGGFDLKASVMLASYAAWDPLNNYHNDVAVITDFPAIGDATATGLEAAHALGHLLGLEDVVDRRSIMHAHWPRGAAWTVSPVNDAFSQYNSSNEWASWCLRSRTEWPVLNRNQDDELTLMLAVGLTP